MSAIYKLGPFKNMQNYHMLNECTTYFNPDNETFALKSVAILPGAHSMHMPDPAKRIDN